MWTRDSIRLIFAAAMFPFGLLFAPALTTSLFAQSLKLVPERDLYLPAHVALVQADPSGALTFPLLARTSRTHAWSPMKDISLGVTKATVWARLRIENRRRENRYFLEFTPVLPDIRVYVPHDSGRFRVLRSGRSVPYDLYAMKHRNFLFPLRIPAGADADVYFRFEAAGSAWISSWLRPPEAFRRKDYGEQFYFGLFFGILLIIAVLNLFFFAAVREFAYLFYVFYVLGIGASFFTAHNFPMEFLWPDAVHWNTYNSFFVTGLAVLNAVLFAAAFVRSRSEMPKMHRVYTALAILLVLILLCMVLHDPFLMTTPLVIVTGVSISAIYVGALRSLFRGYRPARYFVGGWTLLLFMVFMEVLLNLGILPIFIGGMEISVQQHHFLIIIVLEMTFLSLALADRYRTLRTEKEDAQQRLRDDRARIASDIHDSVGAELTGLIMQVENRAANASENTSGLAGRMRLVLQNLRDIVFLLNQRSNIAESLEVEMRDYLERLKGLGDYAVDYELTGVGATLAPEQALHTLRVFSEWMTNIIKHSRGKYIRVRLRKGRNGFYLLILNDGNAFSWSGRYEGLQSGLRGIRYRAEALKGKAWSRAWKGGTSFKLSAPIRNSDRRSP